MSSRTPSEDRRVLVTGANRGIGYALCSALAEGGAQLIVTARDETRGRAAAARLRSAHPGTEVELRVLDVSDPTSIRALTDDLLAAGDPLDAVINNAGLLMAPPSRELTSEGVEVTLATNALGPMLLTERLTPILAPAARVVSLTSRLHLPGSRGEPIDFDPDDPNLDHGYNPDRAYKNSKLALIWVSSELDRRLPDKITSNTVCPGFVPTTAARHTSGWMRFKLRWIVPRLPFAVTVEEAAADVLWALDAPDLAGRGGLYLADRAIADPSPDARDAAQAATFWSLAHSMWEGESLWEGER